MKISRRSVLRYSGLTAALLALTGCSASSGSAILGGDLPDWMKSLFCGSAASSSASSETAASSAASASEAAAGEAAASSAASSEAASSAFSLLPAYDADPLTADLLIESKVEGGITRLCAVFRDADTIPEVGPLRSGRDQFLQLLMPHQALYYHDGESIFCTQFINVYDYSGLNIGGKSYFNTPVHPHVAHRDNRGRNVAYEHTEFTSGKEIKQAAGNAGIGLTYANETPFFHFADYRTAASNDLPGAPAAKTISITHSESYRTRLTYNSWGRNYKLEMYNRSKKAYENTVDELTGKQLSFDNVVVCFADIAAYAGDSHDVQSVNYVAGGQAYLFTRGGVQVGRWEKPHPTHPLKFYTETGEEMTLNRGKTYLALVDNDEWSNFSY